MTPTVDPIVAALESGDALAAETLCRAQLQAKPDAADLLILLALSLWRQGHRAAALEVYAQLTQRYPRESMHWGNYATALRMAGDLEAAEAAAEEAVRLAPDDPEHLDQLGMLQLRLGKPLQARHNLLRAFGKAPESPVIRIDAARACTACRDYRAEDLLRPWREWLPLEDSLQFDLASVFVQLSEADKALELVEDIVRRTPSYGQAQLLRAAMYERVNRLDEAESLLDWMASGGVQLDPEGRSQLVHQRAQLATRRHDYAKARELLERAGPGNDADCEHWFSLGSACDKLGDTAAAMRALETAHAWQLEALRAATPHLFETGAEVLPRANGRVTVLDYQNWPRLKAPDASQSPVFVVGFPRSGTTLLEQMLDAHPRLQSMDERPFFNMLANQLDDVGIGVPDDLGKLNQRDCDELRKGYLTFACSKVPRRWNARLVDKNPLNMLWVPMIYRMFPRAQLILAVRHPCDVILSCYMQNFRAAPLAVASQSLEHLARAYVAAMKCWLYHVNLFRPDVFVSRYEDLVDDMLGQSCKIASFLALDDAESMLHFDERAKEKGYIKTPSYSQVIEPINTRSLGRWRQYREYFEPALPILQPMLEHWHYTTEP